MNRLILLFLLVIGYNFANAQLNNPDSLTTNSEGKNLIKLNLTALPLNTFSGVYERAVSRKTAVGLGFRYMAKGGLPFIDQIESAIDDAETSKHLTSLRLGNYAISPEVKFYLGKSVFRGFYIAPFGRYAVYTADLPFEFTVDENNIGERTETIPLEGNITTITGGLLKEI